MNNNAIANTGANEIVVNSGDNNKIRIADEVVAVIAGKAVSEIQGVYEMSGGFAGGIGEVLSGKKNLAKGIKVIVTDKDAKIDVNIIVEYGVRIPEIAFEIQTKVKKAVETMTGLKVTEVNVHVQGVNTNVDKRDREISE
ncbi:MAG: Asp23/Gls24 family envelope stress response protein [Clostridia bacterium]|nr:Asp23/Gls24 family envelope stress response protein [Clostridia bacterium]